MTSLLCWESDIHSESLPPNRFVLLLFLSFSYLAVSHCLVMKFLSGRSISAWFGYTRRERRASFILLILIIIIGGARYAVPQSAMEISITSDDGFSEVGQLLNPAPADTPQTVPRSAIKKSGTFRVLDLNSCDSAALESLPGIGPVLSARIIKYRNLLGGFAFKDQLLEVYGLSPETFELIAGRVSADSSDVRRIDLNSADFRELIRLPYLDKFEVNSILKYRELEGKFEDVDDLFDNKLVSVDKKSKVRVYFKIE